MLAHNSIVRKLVLVITLSSAAIFAAALAYNYASSRAMLEKELESNARNLALSLVNRVEIELSAVAKTTEGMARAIEIGAYAEPELLSLLRSTLEANPDIYGSTIAFEPYAFSAGLRLYAPYFELPTAAPHPGRFPSPLIPHLRWVGGARTPAPGDEG